MEKKEMKICSCWSSLYHEFWFQVGPIPIDDGIGKEIVTQLKTTINSNKTFYTDSNGRDFLKRVCCIIFFLVNLMLCHSHCSSLASIFFVIFSCRFICYKDIRIWNSTNINILPLLADSRLQSWLEPSSEPTRRRKLLSCTFELVLTIPFT